MSYDKINKLGKKLRKKRRCAAEWIVWGRIFMRRLRDHLMTVLVIFIAVTAAALAFIMFYDNSRKLDAEQTERRMNELAKNNARFIEERFSAMTLSLRSAAGVLGRLDDIASAASLKSTLNVLSGLEGGLYSNLAVITPDGRLYFSGGKTLNITDSASFQEISKGTALVTDVKPSYMTGKPSVHIISPIYNGDKYSGSLYADIYSDGFSPFFLAEGYDDGVRFAITDGNGMTVASSGGDKPADDAVKIAVPAGVKNWELSLTAPPTPVSAEYKANMRYVIYLVSEIFLIFLLVFVYMLIKLRQSRSGGLEGMDFIDGKKKIEIGKYRRPKNRQWM